MISLCQIYIQGKARKPEGFAAINVSLRTRDRDPTTTGGTYSRASRRSMGPSPNVTAVTPARPARQPLLLRNLHRMKGIIHASFTLRPYPFANKNRAAPTQNMGMLFLCSNGKIVAGFGTTDPAYAGVIDRGRMEMA